MGSRSGKIRKSPEMKPTSGLGSAIRILRKGQNLSQQALAALASRYEKAGKGETLHKQRISEIENGWVADPHANTLFAIAFALGTTVDDLYARARELEGAPASNHEMMARDLTFNVTIEAGRHDLDKFLARLQKITGLAPESALQALGLSQSGQFTYDELQASIQRFFLEQNLSRAFYERKYLKLAEAAEMIEDSAGLLKSQALRLHHCLGNAEYEQAHALLEVMLESGMLSDDRMRDLTFDYFQTGYLHFANSGNRDAIARLYTRASKVEWRELDPKLLCLLAEMQQEIATRDLDSALLEENFNTLAVFEEACAKDRETHEYLCILRALCLRRLGERNNIAALDDSIVAHRKLLGNQTRRFIEISNNFGITLLRRFEATGDICNLDEAEAILTRVEKPRNDTLLSELQAYPKVLNGLGNLYRHRMVLSGESEQLTASIEYYTKAESYWSEERAPYEWAMLQKNKAKAYLLFAKQHPVSRDLLLKAISDTEKSMRYRNETQAPYQHRSSQVVLEDLKTLLAERGDN